jgi:hypothetical protein
MTAGGCGHRVEERRTALTDVGVDQASHRQDLCLSERSSCRTWR